MLLHHRNLSSSLSLSPLPNYAEMGRVAENPVLFKKIKEKKEGRFSRCSYILYFNLVIIS
jgi:hypothetical protein